MTKTRPFRVIAEVNKIETRSGGGLRISFDTNEVDPQESTLVMQYMKNQGWLLFSPVPIEKDALEELPDAPKLENGQKTQSQRLRAVLYLVWQAQYKDKEKTAYRDFEVYYNSQTDRIINTFKEQLT